MADKLRDIDDGTLTVRTARDGDARLVSFCGELDLANAATAEAELGFAMEVAKGGVVVDLRELEFIDSSGIALLVAALRRNPGGDQLRFVPSRSPAVLRVLELTGVEQRLPLAEHSHESLC